MLGRAEHGQNVWRVQEEAWRQFSEHGYFTSASISEALDGMTPIKALVVIYRTNCRSLLLGSDGKAQKWALTLSHERCAVCYFTRPHASACYFQTEVPTEFFKD